MGQVRSFEEAFHATTETELDPEFWNLFVQELGARFRGLESIRIAWEEVSRQGIGVALERINQTIGPAAERIRALSELGFLVATSTTSRTLALGAVLEFTITAGDARELFSPSPFVFLGRTLNATDYGVGKLRTYDPETGILQVEVVSLAGNPGPHADWSIGALAGSTIAQLLLLDQGKAERQAAEAARTLAQAAGVVAVEAKDLAVPAAGTATARAQTATEKAAEASASALAAAASAASVNRGGANGVAPLDANSRLPAANLLERHGDYPQTTTDWNTVLTSGRFMGLNAANAPVAGVWFIGEAVAHNGSWVTQTVWRFTDNSPTDAGQWRRSSRDVGGARVWDNWKRVRVYDEEFDARYGGENGLPGRLARTACPIIGDWNAVKENGWFHSSANAVANSPNNTQNWQGYVETWPDQNWVVQRVWNVTHVDAERPVQETYVRKYNHVNGWTGWRRVLATHNDQWQHFIGRDAVEKGGNTWLPAISERVAHIGNGFGLDVGNFSVFSAHISASGTFQLALPTGWGDLAARAFPFSLLVIDGKHHTLGWFTNFFVRWVGGVAPSATEMGTRSLITGVLLHQPGVGWFVHAAHAQLEA